MPVAIAQGSQWVWRRALNYMRFHRVYWLGDGGVYAIQYTGNERDADAAVAAADGRYKCFEQFSSSAPGGNQLSLRITATLIEVVLHPDPSQWYGRNLNIFLKYEREIGSPDALIISSQLYEKLSRDARKRFPKYDDILLPNKESIRLYEDSHHPRQRQAESDLRFMLWLQNHARQFPPATCSITGKRDHDVAIADTVIVDAAPTEAGYSKTYLTTVEHDWTQFHSSIILLKHDDWQHVMQESISEPGIKAAPRRVTVPNTDTSSLIIECARVGFGIAQPFHKLLIQRPDLQENFAPSAFAFQSSEGRTIPGILGIHALVIVTGTDNKVGTDPTRYLLVAHRVYRETGYASDTWSASFEEQFNPVDAEINGKHIVADKDLLATVTRGIQEEFLTYEFDLSGMSIQLHAIFVEADILNLQVMAAVILPTTSFAEVKAMWPKARDAKDHDALAVLPIRQNVLWQAISASGPGGLLESYSGPRREEHVKHPWHPTSRARLACCLWMLKSGLL